MRSRRGFLAGLGAATLAAPFCRLLTGEARAGGVGPRRLLVMATPNGTMPDHLWPAGGERDFRFADGSILEPLEAVRDRITVIRGLQYYNATNHEGGMSAMLTNGDGPTSLGLSVDQVVAAHIGRSTRMQSLELGVQTGAWGGSSQTRMCYGPGGVLLPPDDDPTSVYDRLFGDVLLGDEAAATLRDRRARVLDITRGQLNDLHARLGAVEQSKLDAHLGALADMERALDIVLTCEPGDRPDAGWMYDNDRFPDIGAAQRTLAVQALACGVTNVVSLQWAHTVSPVVFSWLGLSDGHHTLSHADPTNAAGVADYVLAERWFAEQFRALLDDLASLPDPEGGGSLLDTTLVVWAQEMGDGRLHVCTDVPWVLAGATPILEGGRYLALEPTNHVHLLVSICRAFGMELDSFGNELAGNGPIPGLFRGVA
ncbi:MAG: hypothetical protein ACI8PZ_001970 [Myxococcota bacterium]|jgi:hypothetical protein